MAVNYEDVGSLFIVVIHTNSYSGNFEREMAGYVAGIWDGETHGGNQARIFDDETDGEYQGLTDKAGMVPRENGHGGVPVSIWPTPGRLNNGAGFHYNAVDGDEDEALRRAVESMKAFQAPSIARAQARLDNEDFEDESKPGAWTKEACERTIRHALESIKRIESQPLGRYPAYESVAIFFDQEPTPDELDLMWERAKKFCDPSTQTGEFRRTDGLKVTSLELIKRERRVEIIDTNLAKRS